MDQMQNEAMERLKQMYSKSRPQKSEPDIQKHEVKQPVINPTKSTDQKLIVENKTENILELFMKDKEKSLIMLLIVILISEQADSTLVLALMYLIL